MEQHLEHEGKTSPDEKPPIFMGQACHGHSASTTEIRPILHLARRLAMRIAATFLGI